MFSPGDQYQNVCRGPKRKLRSQLSSHLFDDTDSFINSVFIWSFEPFWTLWRPFFPDWILQTFHFGDYWSFEKENFPRNLRYIISHPISVQEGDGSLFLPDFNVGTFSGTDRWKGLSSNKSIDQVMWYNLLQSVTTLVRNPSRHSGGLKKDISNF